MGRLNTTGEIARKLGVAVHRIEYLIESRHIQAASRAGKRQRLHGEASRVHGAGITLDRGAAKPCQYRERGYCRRVKFCPKEIGGFRPKTAHSRAALGG
jgi:hypothetical protein